MTSKSANFDSKTVIFNSKNVNFETQKCQFQLQMCEFLFQNRQYLIITMCSYLNILSFFLNVYILSKSKINMQLCLSWLLDCYQDSLLYQYQGARRVASACGWVTRVSPMVK
jgi:hypothetical protein